MVPAACLSFGFPTVYPRRTFCRVGMVAKLEFEVKTDGIPSAGNIRPYGKASTWVTLYGSITTLKLLVGGSSSCITQRTLLFPFKPTLLQKTDSRYSLYSMIVAISHQIMTLFLVAAAFWASISGTLLLPFREC